MSLLHSRKRGTTQGIQAIDLAGKVEDGMLQRAGRYLFAKYQPLRCTIIEAADGLFFNESALFEHIQIRTLSFDSAAECDLDAHVESELNIPLDPSVALWSLELLRHRERLLLILKFHHAIIDGDGLFRIARDVLKCLNGMEPPLDSDGSLAGTIDTSLRDTIPRDSPAGNVIEYHQKAPLEDRRTRWCYVQLPENQGEAIHARGQRQGLQSNSLLAALLAKAFSEVSGVNDPLEFRSAVSLRDGLVQIDKRGSLGCYIGVASTRLNCAATSVVDIAKQYQKELYQDVLYRVIRRQPWDFRTLTRGIETIDASGRFTHGIGLTNLGRPSIDVEGGHLRVLSYRTMNGRNAGNVALVLNALEFSGRLGLSFVYVEPLFERSAVEAVVQSFAKHVHALTT